ncbi:MAG: DUF885 family protein, partial [Ginsengibacter sp.]
MIYLNKTCKYIPVLLFVSLSATIQAQTDSINSKSWVEKSNSYTKILIDIDEKYLPEFGSSQGLAFYDSMVSVPTTANILAKRKEKEDAVAILKEAIPKENNLSVKQDLNILITQSELGFRQEDFEMKKAVSFLNATGDIFRGLQTLLDDQTIPERRKAAVTRVRKYAGLESGYSPITDIYKERTIAKMSKPGMIYPSKQSMQVQLSRNQSIIKGIADLFKKYKITGWEDGYAALKKQLEDYDAWINTNVLPKARTDFKLPPEQYQLALEGYGIDLPPAQIASMAHALFTNIQKEMKPIAAELAKKYHLPSNDYRAVIKFLKKDQLLGDSIIPVYKDHLSKIEEIIKDHHIVTLPERPAIIRLATEAETAQQPAPHMVAPPFLNNTGERGVFVLPLNMP